MGILIDKDTKVLVQGITGKEGSRAVELMKAYGVEVPAGVTPKKGGQIVHDVPVFNTVREACEEHEVNVSLVVVPPLAAKSAVLEAFESKIKLVVVFTENVPVHDAAAMIAKARECNARLVGPSSVGILTPGASRVGPIGGAGELIERIYKKGEVGVISKSGGMTNETSWVVRQAGFGQSTVVGIGGDMLIGTTYADCLRLFEEDEQTKAVVVFGEVGGTYEDEIAELLQKGEFTKPLIVFIGGKFVEQMPRGVSFGHAGALIEKEQGKPSEKCALLERVGAKVARKHHEIGALLRDVL